MCVGQWHVGGGGHVVNNLQAPPQILMNLFLPHLQCVAVHQSVFCQVMYWVDWQQSFGSFHLPSVSSPCSASRNQHLGLPTRLLWCPSGIAGSHWNHSIFAQIKHLAKLNLPCSLFITYCSIDLTYCSIDLTYCSIDLTYCSIDLTYCSIDLTYCSIDRQLYAPLNYYHFYVSLLLTIYYHSLR